MTSSVQLNGYRKRGTYMIFAVIAILSLYCGHLLFVAVFRSGLQQTLLREDPAYPFYPHAVELPTFNNSKSHFMPLPTVSFMNEGLPNGGVYFRSKQKSKEEKVPNTQRIKYNLRQAGETHNGTEISVSKSTSKGAFSEIERIGDPNERSKKFRMALYDDLPEAAKSCDARVLGGHGGSL
eukprot:GHVT01080433.1.p2 GENE.GHVT01080433.1~~GHVT01080433.1.p2  ORF type:complete len:180 (-),score=6.88 GHVT01080433.1:1110-1649(-)